MPREPIPTGPPREPDLSLRLTEVGLRLGAFVHTHRFVVGLVACAAVFAFMLVSTGLDFAIRFFPAALYAPVLWVWVGGAFGDYLEAYGYVRPYGIRDGLTPWRLALHHADEPDAEAIRQRFWFRLAAAMIGWFPANLAWVVILNGVSQFWPR